MGHSRQPRTSVHRLLRAAVHEGRLPMHYNVLPVIKGALAISSDRPFVIRVKDAGAGREDEATLR